MPLLYVYFYYERRIDSPEAVRAVKTGVIVSIVSRVSHRVEVSCRSSVSATVVVDCLCFERR